MPTKERGRPLTLPPDDSGGELASFAFSPDNRWLAIGLHRKMLLYDRIAKSWGASVQGDHKRSPLVGPMRFTADSRRVITLEDQLQVSVYDVATGARLGRHVPAFENWEGSFKVSDDGSRIVIYKFVSDTFEVLDGQQHPAPCSGRHHVRLAQNPGDGGGGDACAFGDLVDVRQGGWSPS